MCSCNGNECFDVVLKVFRYVNYRTSLEERPYLNPIESTFPMEWGLDPFEAEGVGLMFVIGMLRS